MPKLIIAKPRNKNNATNQMFLKAIAKPTKINIDTTKSDNSNIGIFSFSMWTPQYANELIQLYHSNDYL